MKKIINDPGRFVDEMVEGIVLAYGDKVRLLGDDKRILLSGYPAKKGKVGIVTGGGSGHLPVFLGYIGKGMLDGCAIGEVFASPAASKMADMVRSCDSGGGVLCLFGNYGGDNMNFDMACEMVEMDDIQTRIVKVNDDVASSPKDTMEKRRGVAGMVYAFKAAGAAAEKMMDLNQVAAIAEKTIANTRTMGVATSPCIVPQVGKPTFSIGEEEIEVGMGIHGEPGIEVCAMMSANQIAEKALDMILNDMPVNKGGEVSVMVNGLGATPLEELMIVYRKVHLMLSKMGINIYMPHIGEFATSMEMAGLSVTILKLDNELKELLKSPASTPFYTNHNILEI